MSSTNRSLRALIIDTDPATRAGLRSVLAEAGWDAIEVDDGPQGVEAFAQQAPNLVLIDLLQPAVGGLNVLGQIWARADRRRVPLLVMADPNDTETIDRAFDQGAFDSLAKPLNVRLMRRRLLALLHVVEVEQAIHRAKREWEVTLDVVLEAIFVTNEHGRIIRCNRAATRLFADNYSAILGRSIDALFCGANPDEPPPGTAFTVGVTETQFPQLPGWYQVSNHRVSSDGQGASNVHVVRDITAQRQAEQALKESELHSRALVENLMEGILLLDAEGQIKFASPAVDTILGYSAEEILGHSAVEHVHPDQQEIDRQRFRKLVPAAGCVERYETQVEHKDGSWRWLEVTARNSLDLPGVNAVVLTCDDITQRRQAEQALAMQAKVLEQMSEGVFITDAALAIAFTNRAFEAMFGYGQGELIGQPVGVLDAAPLDLGPARAITAQLNSQGVWTGEIENRRKDGAEFVTANRVSTMDVGDQRYYVGLKTDITEHKQTQAWILNTQKLADLGTLAAGVAHELNSPLQVITGISESLMRRLDANTLAPDYLKRNLDVVHRNGWRCAEIIRSLHTYARVSGGQLAPAQLNDLLRDGLLLMEHQLSSWSNIAITTDLAGDLPELVCDRNQITQVLINLLTNARDAMPEGGVITLTTRFDPPNRNIVLQVADTGTGIPEAVRTKIFDPFFTTKPIGKGTGLGLSIVAGIIRAYGGEISVDSQEGVGTTFTVQFPAAVPEGVFAPAEPAGAGRFDEVSAGK